MCTFKSTLCFWRRGRTRGKSKIETLKSWWLLILYASITELFWERLNTLFLLWKKHHSVSFWLDLFTTWERPLSTLQDGCRMRPSKSWFFTNSTYEVYKLSMTLSLSLIFAKWYSLIIELICSFSFARIFTMIPFVLKYCTIMQWMQFRKIFVYSFWRIISIYAWCLTNASVLCVKSPLIFSKSWVYFDSSPSLFHIYS